jgi:hypothetical protein
VVVVLLNRGSNDGVGEMTPPQLFVVPRRDRGDRQRLQKQLGKDILAADRRLQRLRRPLAFDPGLCWRRGWRGLTPWRREVGRARPAATMTPKQESKSRAHWPRAGVPWKAQPARRRRLRRIWRSGAASDARRAEGRPGRNGRRHQGCRVHHAAHQEFASTPQGKKMLGGAAIGGAYRFPCWDPSQVR